MKEQNLINSISGQNPGEANHDLNQNKNGSSDYPPRIKTIFESYETLRQKQHLELTPKEQKNVIALAIMLQNPKDLEPLADIFQTTRNLVATYYCEAIEDPKLRELGFAIERTIFESKKKFTHFDEKFQSATDEIRETITTNEQKIVECIENGMSNKDIAELYGISTIRLSQHIVVMRKKFQPIMQKHTIKPVSTYKNQTLSTAAHSGSLGARQFVRRWYCDDALIKAYNREKRTKVDPKIIGQGYVPLRHVFKDGEYKSYVENEAYQPYILKHNRRAYVLMEDIEKLREIRSGYLSRGHRKNN